MRNAPPRIIEYTVLDKKTTFNFSSAMLFHNVLSTTKDNITEPTVTNWRRQLGCKEVLE